MASNYEPIEYDVGDVKGLFDSCIKTGKIVEVDHENNKADIEIVVGENTESFLDVPIHYHCPEKETVNDGHLAFEEDDEVYVLHDGSSFPLSSSTLKIIGLVTGLKKCLREYLYIKSGNYCTLFDTQLNAVPINFEDPVTGPVVFPCLCSDIAEWYSKLEYTGVEDLWSTEISKCRHTLNPGDWNYMAQNCGYSGVWCEQVPPNLSISENSVISCPGEFLSDTFTRNASGSSGPPSCVPPPPGSSNCVSTEVDSIEASDLQPCHELYRTIEIAEQSCHRAAHTDTGVYSWDGTCEWLHWGDPWWVWYGHYFGWGKYHQTLLLRQYPPIGNVWVWPDKEFIKEHAFDVYSIYAPPELQALNWGTCDETLVNFRYGDLYCNCGYQSSTTIVQVFFTSTCLYSQIRTWVEGMGIVDGPKTWSRETKFNIACTFFSQGGAKKQPSLGQSINSVLESAINSLLTSAEGDLVEDEALGLHVELAKGL